MRKAVYIIIKYFRYYTIYTLYETLPTELYDTAYPPKLPIIDGLLYNGTYLFVGSPKIGKSFFMAQIGYHVSMGLPLWGYPVRPRYSALSCFRR